MFFFFLNDFKIFIIFFILLNKNLNQKIKKFKLQIKYKKKYKK